MSSPCYFVRPGVFLFVVVCEAGCTGGASTLADASGDASSDVVVADTLAPPGLTAIPLSIGSEASCLPHAYTASVTIGSTPSVRLAVDTGSSTVGVAASDCTSCGAGAVYTPGATATDQHAMAMVTYGSNAHTSWTGEIYDDTLTLAPGLAAPVRLAAIHVSEGFFEGFQGCTDPHPYGQGILGIGPISAAVAGTDDAFDRLVAVDHVPDVFATRLCAMSGTLWVGGYDPAATTAAPQYTPISASAGPYYAVALTSITVAGQSVPIATTALPDSVIDTGTPDLRLSADAFHAITTALAADPGFQAVFESPADADAGVADADAGANTEAFSAATWFSTDGACTMLPQTKAQLDAMLPGMTLVFGTDPGIQVQASATESYLVQYNVAPYGTVWCNGLSSFASAAAAPAAAIVGYPVLRSSVVVFDRAQQRIGFAPHAPCP